MTLARAIIARACRLALGLTLLGAFSVGVCTLMIPDTECVIAITLTRVGVVVLILTILARVLLRVLYGPEPPSES